jgi:hypothetical protein
MKAGIRFSLGVGAVALGFFGATEFGWARSSSVTPSGDVYIDTFKDIEAISGTPAAPTFITQTSTLAPGSYLMQAKIVAFGARSFARVVCQLRYPGWTGSIATTDQSSATVGSSHGSAEDQTLTMMWAATLGSSGPVKLACWPEEATGRAPQVSDATLVVMPVTSIGG